LFSLHAQQSSTTAPSPSPAKTEAKPAEKEKAASKKPADPIDRIKEEGLKRSQVMETLSHLTDVIGPRLTGSPGLKRANEWTRAKLAEWGLENAHLEAWGPFGKGWSLERFSAQVIAPQCIPLIAYPKAWSPGLDGTLVAEVVHLDARNEADLARYKGKLKGAIVLTSPPVNLRARFDPLATRLSDKELLDLADAGAPRTGGRRGRRPPSDFPRKRLEFLIREEAALVLDPSTTGDGGTLFVSGASVPGPASPSSSSSSEARAKRVSAWDKDAPRTLPQCVVAAEHYNRMVRMLKQGESLKMAVELAVAFHDADLQAYNTIAEIPGTDLKDELVMLGGHMDSWHSGTGATDNAAGISVALEAVRILKALDLKPRRTIRIALWTGEEQGLLGSRAYVTDHFGKLEEQPARPATTTTTTADASASARANGETSSSPASPSPSAPASTSSASGLFTKPEYERFSAYFNLDNGTGKVRGVYLQGNEAVRPTFRKWLQPFREMGAATLSLSNTGGTDHLSFDRIGLPGFQFIQDRIDYGTRTHHSNQDVYDRIQADDMKQAAVIMASFVYNAAMLDEKLPRKPRPERAPRPDSAAR
jgi:hypothetical protein